MITKEQLRNHWFFKKYEIKDGMPLMGQVWRYQWNHKAIIFIYCGVLSVILYEFL